MPLNPEWNCVRDELDVRIDGTASRKPPSECTVLGTPVPRIDMAAMATGQLEFVDNVRVPGMLHGAVVRPPAVGATLAALDEGSVLGRAGVVKVVVRRNFVGIVAEKPWQALRAARYARPARSSSITSATPLRVSSCFS